jgi:aspartyl-tRNA(Asn)/glutamyl-tRNA(Gln) amidotransferase subunit A
MPAQDLAFASATELAALVRGKRASPVEVLEALLARIERLDPTLNAYCTVTAEAARRHAAAAETAVMRGDALGPLHGVPFSVKDLVITEGVRTTWGSRIYEQHVPSEDAPAVGRLKAAGAIMVGKTTSPEFGWKGATDSPLFGISRNPWNLGKTPGGSSGGAAAAAAASLGPLHIGTDGGGSIRIPGSFCGIFGLKPTFGLVPTFPPGPAGTLAHLGPMTRTVADAALMLDVMAGPDDRDPFSFPPVPPAMPALAEGISGRRVAWSPTLGYADVHPEVQATTAAAARRFQELGCHVEEVDKVFDDPDPMWATLFYGGIGARLHHLLPTWRTRMDPGLVEVVEEAPSITGIQFAQASLARGAFHETARKLFLRHDLLLTPTLAVPPFAAGESAPPGLRRGSRLAWTAFTYPFNLTGQPAATLPCGFTSDGLPIGLQIVGPRLADGLVLRAAAAFERLAPWSARQPGLA